MPQPQQDEALQACIARYLAATDQKAKTATQEKIAALLWPRIMGIAILHLRRSWHAGGSWHVAEDIAIETFMAVLGKLPDIEDMSRIMGYAYIIMLRQFQNTWRKAKRESPVDILPDTRRTGD